MSLRGTRCLSGERSAPIKKKKPGRDNGSPSNSLNTSLEKRKRDESEEKAIGEAQSQEKGGGAIQTYGSLCLLPQRDPEPGCLLLP